MENSLVKEEFRKLFPNFDIQQFVTTKNKVYYSGDGLNLSLYSPTFWRARRKVVSLNLSEQGMSIWRQDKQNFLKNWRNFVESHPQEERVSHWVERWLFWYYEKLDLDKEDAEDYIRRHHIDYKKVDEALKRFAVKIIVVIVIIVVLYKTW